MSEDELISNSFGCPAEAVRELRDADEEFDIICKDFAALSEDITGMMARRNLDLLRYFADAAGSVSSLADEIERKLEWFADSKRKRDQLQFERNRK
jgi:uncharacterized tellurite resistance protein B-like protein